MALAITDEHAALSDAVRSFAAERNVRAAV
jgi:hypothetical protein